MERNALSSFRILQHVKMALPVYHVVSETSWDDVKDRYWHDVDTYKREGIVGLIKSDAVDAWHYVTGETERDVHVLGDTVREATTWVAGTAGEASGAFVGGATEQIGMGKVIIFAIIGLVVLKHL